MNNKIVDPLSNIQNASIYKDMSCILNQTDISANANKFYILQLLVNFNKEYIVYSRYGRVGETGKTQSKTFSSEYSAIAEFKRRFRSKTGNVWGNKFVDKPKKYALVELEEVETEVVETIQDSQLLPKIQNFMKDISDIKNMTQTISDFDIDTKKLPLGKISKDQINRGYKLLNLLKMYIDFKAAPGLNMPDPDTYKRDTQLALSSRFWTLIPYACGRNKPPIIDTSEKINKYTELLEVLENIEIATKIMINSFGCVDDIYKELNISLNEVKNNSEEWNMISTYVQNTHAPTHYYNLELLEILSVNKEHKNIDFFNSEPNHRLLFHGSRTSNFMGILSEGLRIPKSSQVTNGSVLGRGIYFADSVSKSFNYCNTNDIGYIIICEVALGNNPHEVYKATFDDQPNPVYTSRIAYGKSQPSGHIMYNDVHVPSGKLTNLNIDSGFLYDEYVIYDTNRYKFCYVIKLKMK